MGKEVIKMDKIEISQEVMTALNGSIEKWNKIANHGGVDRGINNCPLCELCNDTCSDCPVYLKTGLDGCEDTPYSIWADHHNNCHKGEIRRISICPECDVLANQELKFLHDLKDECEVINYTKKES